MPEVTDDDTNGPSDRALRELLDGERRRELIEERRRVGNRRRQADESVTLSDVLGALAAHGARVAVETPSGLLPAGPICEVGRDYVAVRPSAGTHTAVHVVPVAAVRSVRQVEAAPGPASTGSGVPPLDLAERLRELAAHRAVARVLAGSSATSGLLRRVGLDVVVVDEGGRDAFVALSAITEVVVSP